MFELPYKWASAPLQLPDHHGHGGKEREVTTGVTGATPEGHASSKPKKLLHFLSSQEKILHWLFFGVLMALAPFLALMLDDVTNSTPMSLISLFGHGELLIVTSIIAAGGVGDLFGTEVSKELRVPRLIVLCSCLAVLIVTCLWFAAVSALLTTQHPVQHPGTVAWGSVWLFSFGVLAGGSALLMSQAKEA